MEFWRQVLRGLPVVALVCGVLPVPAEAQFSQQGPKLVATDAIGDARQGASVALSSDGNSAIVGGFGDNDFAGAAWIYIRSGGVWGEQAKLVGTGAIGPARQGSSVSLSADGNTAIAGGPDDDNGGIPFFGFGAAWVYTRSGGVWSQQAKLVATDATGFAQQGSSVSLSADGNIAIVGGPGDGGVGAAWIYIRSGGVWSEQAKLVGTGAIGPAGQGSSVSLSSDGNTAMVGGPCDENVPGIASCAGAAWVFTRSGGVWSQQAKLVGTGAIGLTSLQGAGVSVSGSGNTAVVGGPGDSGGVGATWVFTRSGEVWSQQAKLVGTGAVNGSTGAQQGRSVSLSADGNTATVGAPQDDGNQSSAIGAAWVFAQHVFAGTPGKANCHGKSVSALARQFGGLNNAAAALGFDSVSALQNAIMAFCGG
jgi:hypothetical protein